MRLTVRPKNHVWVILTKEYTWYDQRGQYWATNEDCFLSRERAREAARDIARQFQTKTKVVKAVF